MKKGGANRKGGGRKLRWKIIPGFSRYEISECGDVKTLLDGSKFKAGHVLKRRHDLYRKGNYAWYKLIADSGTTHWVRASHLVLIAFVGPRPSLRYWACHWDDNQKNDCVNNLRWALPKENHADARRNGGRDPRGEGNGRAKLTERKVLEIRTSNLRTGVLAKRYHMGKTAIRKIRNGSAWSHLS